jgi:phosphoserine phosphatase RsbU/P
MRDKLYFFLFLLICGLLLYLGHDLTRVSEVTAWALTFGGSMAAAVLLAAIYRFQSELQASRQELAHKQAEMYFALKVQQELFPQQLPQAGGLEFSAACNPASGISGDYYDVLSLQNGHVSFAIADVSGKGISAAILMANLQALLRVVSASAQEPVEVCNKLNSHLHQVTDTSRYATLFYGDWNPETKTVKYVNAGHNPPFLLAGAGRQDLDDGGIPLGVLPIYEYKMGEVSMRPGDLLVLYSDGITEAGVSSGEEFGVKRLESLVTSLKERPLGEIQARVLEAVRTWTGKPPEDDITLMLVRAKEN